MIGAKHPDDLSSNPIVGIVIYEKLVLQIWENINFSKKRQKWMKVEKNNIKEKK
jgi:hypothetical protein